MNDPIYSAEAMLSAAILDQPSALSEVAWVEKDMFFDTCNATVWGCIQHVERVYGHDDRDEFVRRVQAVLLEYHRNAAYDRTVKLTGAYPALGLNAQLYANDLFHEYQGRMLSDAAARAVQIVDNQELTVAEKTEHLRETWTDVLAAASADPGYQPVAGLHTVNEFMTLRDGSHDWVIPGLLERQERFMLIAPEKAGKTVFTRQAALMLASGRHPLAADVQVPEMRTLLVDLENPAGVSRRDFRRQVDKMEGLWSSENENAYILHRPAGVHLGDRADRVMLRQVVERLHIDLLCISPIYKAYDGHDQSWEEQAFGVQKPLDQIREDYDCAIWMEHHAPWGEKGQRQLRPIGSSRWVRWLDYQVALSPVDKKPPYLTMEWNSQQRDELKMRPVRLHRGHREASWEAEWSDREHGFQIAYDRAVSSGA